MMRRLIVGKRGRYCGLFAVCVAALACGSGPNGGTGGTSGGGANPPPFGEDEAGVNPVPLPLVSLVSRPTPAHSAIDRSTTP